VQSLETGERAPWAGMLIGDDDLYTLQRDGRLCAAQLGMAERLRVELVDSHARIDAARQHAADETVALHDRMWAERVGQLSRELASARSDASTWASPWLWGVIGLVVGVAAAVAIGLAFGGG
jgi:hypothetical protein